MISVKIHLRATAVVTCGLLGPLFLSSVSAAQEGDAWQALGDETYAAQCASCHQAQGEGIEGVYPTLIGSEVLLGEADEVIALVLNGRGAMPAFRDILSDEQLAAVLSHERNSWGNDAEVVTAEIVAAQRDVGEAGADEAGAVEDSAASAISLPDGWQEQATQLYVDNCAACHQAQGQGVEGAFPRLAGNAYVVSDPASVIATLISGRGGMPSFRSGLSSEEIAYVLSFVRTSWDNQGSLIDADMVQDVAEGRLSPANPNDPNYRPGAAN